MGEKSSIGDPIQGINRQKAFFEIGLKLQLSAIGVHEGGPLKDKKQGDADMAHCPIGILDKQNRL